MTDFIFLGSKVTMDNDCSHESNRRLLLGRKVMTNLDCIFKSKDHKGLICAKFPRSYMKGENRQACGVGVDWLEASTWGHSGMLTGGIQERK